MPKPHRRTDADYVHFPPYYVFKSHPNQKARNVVVELVWGASLAFVALATVSVVAFLWIRHYLAST